MKFVDDDDDDDDDLAVCKTCWAVCIFVKSSGHFMHALWSCE